jgi:hypothetical protein
MKELRIVVEVDTVKGTANLRQLDQALDGVGKHAGGPVNAAVTKLEDTTRKLGDTTGGAAASGVSKLSGLVKGALIGAVAAAAYEAGKLIVELVRMADEITRVSERTGMSTRAVQELGFVATQSGNSLDQITTALGQMQNRLASGDDSAISAMGRLGLNIGAVLRMKPDEQFYMIARAISALPDPMERTQLAMDLFGRSGAAILPTMVADINTLRDAAPVMSAATVEALDKAGDAWDWLGLKAKVAGAYMLSAFVDVVKGAAGITAWRDLAAVFGDVDRMAKKVEDQLNATGKAALDASDRGARPLTLSMKDLKKVNEDLDRVAKQQWTAQAKAAEDAAKRVADALKKWKDSVRDLRFVLDFQGNGLGQLGNVPTNTSSGLFEQYRDSIGNLVSYDLPRMYEALGAAGNKIEGVSDEFFTGALAAGTASKAWGNVGYVLSTLGSVFDNINSKMGQVAQTAAHMWAIVQAPNEGKTDDERARITSGKWIAGLSAASELTNQLVTGAGRASTAVRGMMSTMASGAAIGTMIMPGIGTAVGAVAGAVVGLVSGWNAAGAAARNANRAADKELDALRAGLLKTYGSLENVDLIGRTLGVDLKGAWGDTTVAGLEHFSALVDEFEAKMTNLQESLKKYGLAWTDLGGEIQQFFGARLGGDLVEDFNTLVAAGVDVEKVTRNMSEAVSAYVIDSIVAGTKIPVAMEPIVRKMIEMGTLTDAAARAMLGLSDASMPSLASIKEAADRYGLSLDALGPKVAQLQITERAKQIVADFDLLIKAGADPAVLALSGMGTQVQELVTQAMRYGLELPASLKPILLAMIDTGVLTDAAGQKMKDLSGLTFAADLTKMFDALILKLDELIETLSGRLTPAIDAIPRDVEIKVRYRDTGPQGSASADESGTAYHMGGLVSASSTARGIPWWAPRFHGGGDVPAWLQAGEFVMSRQGVAAAGAATLAAVNAGRGRVAPAAIGTTGGVVVHATITINKPTVRNEQDIRDLAREVSREIPRVLQAAGY